MEIPVELSVYKRYLCFLHNREALKGRAEEEGERSMAGKGEGEGDKTKAGFGA